MVRNRGALSQDDSARPLDLRLVTLCGFSVVGGGLFWCVGEHAQ
jgi:hypothetical protein